MSGLLVCLCFAIIPDQSIARESVDLIELNHFYDEHGRLVFDQVIFYDWSDADSRYMVRAWRIVKHPAQVPCRDWEDGGYVALWQDEDVLRQVRAASVRETWTQHDPELVEREFWPKEKRRELRSTAAAKKPSVDCKPRPTLTPPPRAAQ